VRARASREADPGGVRNARERRRSELGDDEREPGGDHGLRRVHGVPEPPGTHPEHAAEIHVGGGRGLGIETVAEIDQRGVLSPLGRRGESGKSEGKPSARTPADDLDELPAGITSREQPIHPLDSARQRRLLAVAPQIRGGKDRRRRVGRKRLAEGGDSVGKGERDGHRATPATISL